jgi:2-oxoglutarate/2-oxoacid ferredoxin oxidoreductase subunit alpha
VADQFKGKEKLIAPNVHALELGYQYVKEHLDSPLPITTAAISRPHRRPHSAGRQ